MRTQANWQEVEDLFHSALANDAPNRHQFLMSRCEGNEYLVEEVKRLLNAYECDKNMLDESALELGFAIIDQQDKEESLVGRTILSYKMLEKLGEGGMGAVYLAYDERLDREVALKFISSDYIDGDLLKRRLFREAQAAAKLDHPNICPIYGIEEADGVSFIVMPRISGETLAQLIRNGHYFSRHALLSIVKQIAEAIAAAHARGIIHRDIKPGNVMQDLVGQIHVLDFGLAKLADDASSQVANSKGPFENSTGLVFGTVSYMSPEQLRNEKVDFRTDIFSFGVLMYEICTLKNPFIQSSQADTISSVLSQDLDFRILDASPCPALKPVIQKCLERDRRIRYASADELILALDGIKHRAAPRVSLLGVISSKWMLRIFFVLLVAFGAGAYWSARPARLHHVAVLPLVNNTDDVTLDYLGAGISQGLINRLARQASPADLVVKPFTAVVGYGDPNREVVSAARQLNVEFIVNGSIERVNGQLVARVNSFDNENPNGVWTSDDIVQTDDLLTLEQALSEHILATLQIQSHPARSSSSSISQENGEAYRNYLIGQYYWSKRDAENIQKAILSFNRAIEIDPSYGKAYAGLANSFVLQSLSAYGGAPAQETMIKAKAAAKQAIEIDPENCEAHTALGVVLMKYDWNWPDAEAEFSTAISKNADYAPARYWHSSLLAIRGRRDESIAEANKARELDPFSPLGAVNLARAYYYARQYTNAVEVLRREEESGTNEVKVHYMMGLVQLQLQRYDDARSIFEEIYKQNRLFGSAALGFCYAKMGETKRARAIISDLQQNAQRQTFPSLELGMIYTGLNEQRKACQLLGGALEERHPALISFAVEPLYDGVRDIPECANLLARMPLNGG
jgi:serine/threonine protein kinase/Tfp pilus assembly protein PilF